MARRFTLYVVAAMLAGILLGSLLHAGIDDPLLRKTIAGYGGVVTDLFLRLIKMIIAPLVFATLSVGIAHMGDASRLGRVGLRTLGWFVCASLLSLALGLVMVTWLAPASGAGSARPAPGAIQVTITRPSTSDIREAHTNQPSVRSPTRPSRLASPMCAIPTESVANTSGAMIILIRRRNKSVITPP